MKHRYGISTSFAADAWITDTIPQPNITDKETVLSLARIAADAYIETQGGDGWLDAGKNYNVTDDFGWEGDGLRGHIFANPDNSTVIIGLKGTSPAVFDGAETTTNDKVNDNLLFSCCCARVSMWWTTVCDCYSGTAYTCNKVEGQNGSNGSRQTAHSSSRCYHKCKRCRSNSRTLSSTTWRLWHNSMKREGCR